MKVTENCGVCGKPLIYGTEAVKRTCAFCGKESPTLIYCPEGHYVCDACHSKAAVDVLREVLKTTTSKNPHEILEKVLSHPSVPMHGPEHHTMVPAILLTAVKNAGYPVPEGAVEKAIERGSKVPGGWCGFYGACGAGIGVGIAVSVLTGATPLTGKPRGLANEATSYALGKMVDNGARCCKRATRNAMKAAVEFLDKEMNISLPKAETVECQYIARNKECIKEECPYYSKI